MFKTPLLCLLLVGLLVSWQAAEAADRPQQKKARIVLVGDSTVTDQGGWGQAFAALLNPNAECVNMARAGESSKSYYDQGRWKEALAKKPDFVLIQFGHNDQPGKGPKRETDPKTTYRAYLNKYIAQAQAAGARPILVTSMVRRNFTPEGKIDSSLVPYVDAMKQVASDKKIPLVDLHQRSWELVERIGPEEAKTFGPPHPKLPGKFDNTHLVSQGAQAIAPLVVQELWNVEPTLRRCLPDKSSQEGRGKSRLTPAGRDPE